MHVILEVTEHYDRLLCTALERWRRPLLPAQSGQSPRLCKSYRPACQTKQIPSMRDLLARIGKTLSPAVTNTIRSSQTARLESLHTPAVNKLVAMRQQERLHLQHHRPVRA